MLSNSLKIIAIESQKGCLQANQDLNTTAFLFPKSRRLTLKKQLFKLKGKLHDNSIYIQLAEGERTDLARVLSELSNLTGGEQG